MQKYNWDLNELFTDTNHFYKVIDEIQDDLEKIQTFQSKDIDAYTLQTLLDTKWEIKRKCRNVLVYGSLSYYKNVNSDEAKKMKSEAEKLDNGVTASTIFVEEKIIALGETVINHYMLANPGLTIYSFYFENLFRMTKHVQTDENAKQINDAKNRINTLLAEYNEETNGMTFGTIVIEGEEIELNLSNLSKYSTSKDREVRKKVFEKVNTAYMEKADVFTSLLNAIYTNRNRISNLEKYSSVLDKALFSENLDKQVLTSLMNSVHANIGVIQRYVSLKMKVIGIDSPHLYDVFMPLNNDSDETYTIDTGVEKVRNALELLGKDYLSVIDKLLLMGHVDAECDSDKHQTITFSWLDYAFMNFRGAHIDLKNLAHECGHIAHFNLSKQKRPMIYDDSSVFVGEVASLVNELLLNRYLYETAETEDAKKYYLSVTIENFLNQVYMQTRITEFSTILYSLIENGEELTFNKVSEIYLNLLRKYFGKNIEIDELAKVEWMRLGKLFRWDYYAYQYATGLIIASSIVNNLIDNKTNTLDKYIEFLESGSSKYPLDLLKEMGIILTDEGIIDAAFNILRNDIDSFDKLLTLK